MTMMIMIQNHDDDDNGNDDTHNDGDNGNNGYDEKPLHPLAKLDNCDNHVDDDDNGQR